MRLLLYTLLTLGTTLTARAQQTAQAEWTPDSVTIRFELSESKAVGSNYAVWHRPYLCNDRGDTLDMQRTVVFRGKRNRRYVERSTFYGSAAPQTARAAATHQAGEALLGENVVCSATFARASHPWLWTDAVQIATLREREGCCRVDEAAARTLGYVAYVPPFTPAVPSVPDNTGVAGQLQRTNPVLMHLSAYKPYDPTRVLRKEKGALWVNFELDRHELRHDFRQNAATLDRIVDITRNILADTTSTVKLIQIVGMASIEGSVAHNERLAMERAQALKRYIQQRVPTPDSLYELGNAGEGWADFRDIVSETTLPERDDLLRIIDTEADPNRREQLIRRLNGGRTYAYLVDHVLRDQRNSGYIRVYYDYVPDSVAPVINRAIRLLDAGQVAEALPLLESVRADERSLNPLGVAYFRSGDRQRARICLEQAVKLGHAEAEANLQLLNEVEAAEARRAALPVVQTKTE